MSEQEKLDEQKTIIKISEDITKINLLLFNHNDELKIKTELTKRINSFINNYQKFEKIKRFSIPVIGKINCGKSTILNFLLNLDDDLEYSSNITTKFISIIRHNKNLKGKEPLIYNVKFEQRAYINYKYLYNFEKDGDYIKGNAKEIIKKRNELLANGKLDKLPENYFYIIECYIPLFEGEFEEYADYFEFMDVPGLNESSSQENIDNIYMDKILPLFINNFQFAIFIFDALNYEKLENSTINSRDIFKDFYEKMKSFYCEENINQIKIHDSLFVLNKIDLSNKEGGLEREKKDFTQYLKNRLNIPIEKNSIVLFQADLEYLKKNRFRNFEKYIDYNVIKSKKSDNQNSFNNKIKMNLRADFNIDENILREEEEDEEDEDEEGDENGKDGDKNNKDNNILIFSKIIKNINKSLKKQSYSDSITMKKYLIFKNHYYSNISEGKKKFEANYQKDDLTKNIEKSIKNIYKSFIDNYKEIDKLYNDILLKLNIKKENFEENINKTSSKAITFAKFFEKNDYLDNFSYEKSIFEQLKELEPEHQFIQKIYSNFLSYKDYIEKYHKYKIAIFGEHSSGKSSLLNSLIGLDILPESNSHCTKVILAVQYTKNLNDISLYSAKLNDNELDKSFLYLIQDELIVKGVENIKKELIKINNDSKKCIQYYILNTPIKFLDYFIEEQAIKEKIQFFDTPGLDSLLKEYTDINFSKLIEYVDLFIYCNAFNILNQKESEASLKRMIEFILEKKGYFNFDSFIFLITFYDKISINEDLNESEILSNFKNSIIKIIKKYKENNWDAYINKYRKIIYNDSNISCFYFSKEIYNNEQKIMDDFLDFNKFFTQLNNNFSEKEMKTKLSKTKSYIKKNYINELSNKKDFSKSNIQITDKDRKNLRIIFNMNDNVFETNKSNMDEILAEYNFFKNNLINYSLFKDILSTIIKKLSNENIYFFLSYIIFNITLNLLKYLNLIEINIIKWESSSNNEISIYDKLETKYENYKKELEDIFKIKKKELEVEFNKLYIGIDQTKEINDTIKILSEKADLIYNSYIKDIKKELKAIDELIFSFKKDDIPLIIDHEVILSSFLIFGLVNTFAFALGFAASSEVATGGLLVSLGISSVFGGIFGLGFGALISLIIFASAHFITRYIGKAFNKKKLKVFYDDIMNKIEAMEYKINENMRLFYNSSKNQIEERILSLKSPMKNLINDRKKRKLFLELKEEFIKFLLKFN